jgi:hypothetical protein
MTTPKKKPTAAECRRVAKQIVIATVICEAGMFGYMAATDNLTRDLMQIPLMALPSTAFCALLLLSYAWRLDQE